MSTPALSEIFRQEFKNRCTELIEAGFRKVKETEDYTLDWDEERFTKELYLVMDEQVESLDYQYMDVDFENYEISSVTGELIRVDFKVKRATAKNNVYGFMECKLLTSESRNLYEYRRNGVLRFITGKYASRSDHEHGFMVGYVTEDGLENIIDKLTRMIDNDEKLNTSNTLKENRKDGDLGVYDSKHRRVDGLGELTLTHIFLDFSEDMPTAELESN